MNPKLSEITDVEDIRLATHMRVQFEQELDLAPGFGHIFEGKIDDYWQHVSHAFEAVFHVPRWLEWAHKNGSDIVTWHYLTRHTVYTASPIDRYFSGQVILNSELKNLLRPRELDPYPGHRSPYIEIFKDERTREQSGRGGPVCILLPQKNASALKEQYDLAFRVPESVAVLLQDFPDHEGGRELPLNESHLAQINAKDSSFVRELTEWMSANRGQRVEPLNAINDLQASLKVTLNLIRRKELNCGFPRSTFLCPCHLGGETIGGMAFACRDLVPRVAALVGEAVSNILLSYLRLREDAHAHTLVEEQRKLDEAKSFFINRLSHDFRHPLDTLQSTVAEFSNAFSVIDKQISRINRMMDETILALEGRDPKKLLRPKKNEDKVSEFLADIQSYFRRRFDEKQKRLIVDPVNRAWTIYLDQGMVHEILENLVVNALQHGGPMVRIFVEKHRHKYIFHVEDNGPGIPEEHHQVIFRPLGLNIDAGDTRHGRGLAIARQLAEAHGGTLRLGPADGDWTTNFVLEIPIEDKEDSHDA